MKDAASLNMHSPLAALTGRETITATPATPLPVALQAMVDNHIGSIVIVEEESRRPVGIFTLRDVLVRVAARPNEHAGDQTIGAVMSGNNLVTLSLSTTLYQAALQMARHGLHHLIIVDDGGRLAGIVSQNDIYRLLRGGDKAISGAIRNAHDMHALIAAAAEIRRLTRQMLADGKAAEALTQEISTLNDLLTVRVIEITAAEFTLPDIPWCWLAFGSEGRFEQTFSTDQDNGLIFASADNAAETERLRQAFLPFATEVNQRLDACGYTLCKGNIMAGNPACCLSLEEWRDKFSGWLHAAEPQALLNATIFFDLRPLFGSECLANELRDWLFSRSPNATMFLRFMADNAVTAAPPLGLIHDFSFDKKSRVPHTLDLKAFGTRPFVDAARIFALAHGIPQSSTAQRLRLLADRLHFSAADVAAMLDGFYYIQMLRLRHQQEAAIDAEDANLVDPDTLNELGRHMLKESFKQAKKLQQRLRIDYHL